MIHSCVRGDSSAQKDFYYTYYPLLMRICSRYAASREDAEQWAHDAFLKIFSSLGQFSGAGSFEGWIRKVTVRVCLDHIRARNTRKNETESHTVYNEYASGHAEPYIDNAILPRISREEVFRILQLLPEKQRTVFNLIVFEAYSHKEIAGLLEITENHSYWLLHQARKQLKEILNLSYSQKTGISHEQK